jgi:hypothetical protein
VHARFKWGQGVSDKILYSIKAKDTRPVHADRVLKTRYCRIKDKEIRPVHADRVLKTTYRRIKDKEIRPVHADRVLKTKYRRFKDKEIRPKHERLRWDSMLTCQVLKNIKTFGMCVQGLGGRQDI